MFNSMKKYERIIKKDLKLLNKSFDNKKLSVYVQLALIGQSIIDSKNNKNFKPPSESEKEKDECIEIVDEILFDCVSAGRRKSTIKNIKSYCKSDTIPKTTLSFVIVYYLINNILNDDNLSEKLKKYFRVIHKKFDKVYWYIGEEAMSDLGMNKYKLPKIERKRIIVHLSDLHFGNDENSIHWANQLSCDIKKKTCNNKIDLLIISGDITMKCADEEFSSAELFLKKIILELNINFSNIVIVPGNHDVDWSLRNGGGYDLYWKDSYNGELNNNVIDKEYEVIAVRNEELYKKRFEKFAHFYENIKGKGNVYPIEYEDQAIIDYFDELQILILGLNSSFMIDKKFKNRSAVCDKAIAKAINKIETTEIYKDSPLKIAVIHHHLLQANGGNENDYREVGDSGFFQQLYNIGFHFILHGHVHRSDFYINLPHNITCLNSQDIIQAICSGTFGSKSNPKYPWQYNLIMIENDTMTVNSRKKEEEDGAWEPDYRWNGGKDFYKLPLSGHN